jgi:hypothetical protein
MKTWIIENRFILGILGFVLVLRIPAITDGLPAVFNPTEYFLAKIALSMGARFSPDPGSYIYPPFYSYFLLCLYGCYYAAGRMTGVFPDSEGFAVKFLTDPDMFYIIGRCVSLIFLLLTLWITYRMMLRYGDEKKARIAAGLTAGSITFMHFSASGTSEMLLLLWSVIAVLYYLPLKADPSPNRIFIAALFAGLATGTKYNAGFLVFGLFIYLVTFRNSFTVPIYRQLVIAAGGVVCGFFLPNFHILLAPGRYLQGLTSLLQQMYFAPAPGQHLLPPILYEFLRTELLMGIAFIIGVLYFMKRGGESKIHLTLPLVLTVLIVLTWSKSGLDYLIPVFPIMIYLTTLFISDIVKTGRRQLLVLILIFTPQFTMQCITSLRWMNSDTREMATAWLMDHLEPGDRLCYDNNHYDLGLFDIRRFTDYGAGASILPETVKEKISEYGDSPRQVSFLPVLYDTGTKAQEGFLNEHFRFRRKGFEQLLDERMDYLVTNNRFYEAYLQTDPGSARPELRLRIESVRQFYKDLSKYKPLQIFQPDFWHNGPELSIYRFEYSRGQGG